jgi:alpha-beta hydrolase superfamily lysophospholipase
MKVVEILSQDGLKLRGICFIPKESKKTILLVHGLGEHSGRYSHVMEYFAEKEIAIVAFDLRGHGKSEGQRGHFPNQYLADDDINRMMRFAKDLIPENEIYGFGQSMGANLLLAATMRNSFQCKGLVLASGWFGLAFKPPAWKVILAKMVNVLAGNIALESEINPNELSNDREVAKNYINDEWVQKKISARLYAIVQNNIAYVFQHAATFKTPVFIYHGSNDKITSGEKSLQLSQLMKNNANFKLFNGLKHECHNEKNYREVLKEITFF